MMKSSLKQETPYKKVQLPGLVGGGLKKLTGRVPIVLKKMVRYPGATSWTTSGTHNDIDGSDTT